MLPGFAKLAVKGDWKAICDQAGAAAQDKDALSALSPLFEIALNPQKIVLDTLKDDEGKELRIALKAGADQYAIVSVRNGNVQATQKIDRAMFQKSFTFDDLAMEERALRVSRSNAQAAALMLMTVQYGKENFDDALATIVNMDAKGRFVAEFREELKKILSDAYAEDEYGKLLAKFHMKPNVRNEDMQAEIAKLKVGQEEKNDLIALVDGYKKKFKDFAYLKKVSGPLGTLSGCLAKLQVQAQAQPSRPKTDGLGPGIKLK